MQLGFRGFWDNESLKFKRRHALWKYIQSYYKDDNKLAEDISFETCF